MKAASYYDARPLTPCFGIVAADIDLDRVDLSDQNFVAKLKRDLTDHRAVLFRGQNLSGQRQVDISAALGTVQSTFYKHPRSPHPDVFRVSNDEEEGCTRVGRSGWHIDGTFQARPFAYQTMYFPSVAEGGDTYFVPLKELYDSLGENVREEYDRLWMATGRRECPVHPLVYQHPYRKDEETMLFHCGRPFCSGWYRDESDDDDDETAVNGVEVSKMIRPSAIQDQLARQIESKLDEIGLRMRWQRGDFMISDNLGLAHYASEGTQGRPESGVGLRILHRTTIVGGGETVPMKADGRRSFALR